MFCFSYIAISANVFKIRYTTFVKRKSSFSLNSLQTGCLLGLLSEFYECSQNSLLQPCASTLRLVCVTRSYELIRDYTVFTKINKNGGPEEDREFVCGVKT